jgi:hypothetical protein
VSDEKPIVVYGLWTNFPYDTPTLVNLFKTREAALDSQMDKSFLELGLYVVKEHRVL